MEQRLILSEEKNQIITKTLSFKKSIEILPKVHKSENFVNSGVKNTSLIFADKNKKYNIVSREMQYNNFEKKLNQAGKAYSLYLGEEDDNASTYLGGNIIPLEKNNGDIFISINVAPKSPDNVDLFVLPIIMKYNGDITV